MRELFSSEHGRRERFIWKEEGEVREREEGREGGVQVRCAWRRGDKEE